MTVTVTANAAGGSLSIAVIGTRGRLPVLSNLPLPSRPQALPFCQPDWRKRKRGQFDFLHHYGGKRERI